MSVDPAFLRRPSGLSATEHRRQKVAILVFEEVDILDFAAPFEVFGVADELGGGGHFHVFTVAESPSSLRTHHGLKLVPDYTLEHAPRPDVLVLPGGPGIRTLLGRPGLLEWIGTRSSTALVTIGLRDGARLLGGTVPTDANSDLNSSEMTDEPHETVSSGHAAARTTYRIAPHPQGIGRMVTTEHSVAALAASLHVVRMLLGDELADATERHLVCDRDEHPL